MYNACLAEARKRAGLLRESRAYRKALRLPKGKERTKAFKAARKAVGFTKSALERYAVRLRRRAFHQHLDAHAAQKLAARAYDAVDGWLLGKRGRPRFKGKNQFDTLEGKTNKAGLRFRQDRLEWRGLVLKALIDSEDPVVAHALASRVKFVRLVRRKIRGKHRFSVQLVCEGRPYQKPERKVSEGVVGLDIGPSTVAAVGESGAFLELLAEGVVRKHKTASAGRTTRRTTCRTAGSGPAPRRGGSRTARNGPRPPWPSSCAGRPPTARPCTVPWPTGCWPWGASSSWRGCPTGPTRGGSGGRSA